MRNIENFAGVKSSPDLSGDLEELVEMMSFIKGVECYEDVEPMISPMEEISSLSKRVFKDELPSRDEILTNAPKVKGHFFAIPKIMKK